MAVKWLMGWFMHADDDLRVDLVFIESEHREVLQ